MSVFQQKNSQNWWISVYTNGKRIRVSSGSPDKAYALMLEQTLKLGKKKITTDDKIRATLDAILGTRQQDTRPKLPVEIVWEYYTRHLKIIGSKVSEFTLYRRKREVIRLCAWIAEEFDAGLFLADVSRDVAAAYAQSLVDDGLKSKTRKNILSELLTIWKGAVFELGEGWGNPWTGVVPRVVDSVIGRAFSREEEARVLEACKKMHSGWYTASVIARYTGLRYGDVVHLKWNDLQNGVISVRPSKTAAHGVTVRIPICKPLAAVVDALPRDSEYLLPNLQRRYPNRPEPPFSDILHAAGLSPEHYTFHSWRHTFRTRLSEAGVPDELAMRLGGWTVASTAQRYDHADRATELLTAIEKSL